MSKTKVLTHGWLTAPEGGVLSAYLPLYVALALEAAGVGRWYPVPRAEKAERHFHAPRPEEVDMRASPGAGFGDLEDSQRDAARNYAGAVEDGFRLMYGRYETAVRDGVGYAQASALLPTAAYGEWRVEVGRVAAEDLDEVTKDRLLPEVRAALDVLRGVAGI